MDAKITKERLTRMLSYDWLKIVGLAVAMVFFWTLVFTTSATRITTAQEFTVINYFGCASTLKTGVSDDLTKTFQNGLFSYEVLDIGVVDIGGNEEMGHTLMQTRTATEEGDVVFVPNILDPDGEYELDGKKYQDTYLQSLARSYGAYLVNLDRKAEDSFFRQLENFLDRYYGEYEKESAVLNETLVKADFLARIEKNKDKRFKKDAQIEQGIQDEIARVKTYREALIEFDGYLEEGLVELTKATVKNKTTGELLYERVCGINICPDPEKMPNLTKLVGYWEEVTNEAGEAQAPKLAAKDMHVAIMVFEGMEESFEFESLLYINYIIRSGLA